MKNPFRKKHSIPKIGKLTGVGTVLFGGIISFASLLEDFGQLRGTGIALASINPKAVGIA